MKGKMKEMSRRHQIDKRKVMLEWSVNEEMIFTLILVISPVCFTAYCLSELITF